jgi:2-hydroxy-6-oxonona-2,4-dienedioate hydrolase
VKTDGATGGAAGALRSVWSEVGGLRWHALAAPRPHGTGPRQIVLVHGLGVSSRYMRPAAERLARSVGVSAPDLPGFGRSAKPGHALDVHELADALARWMDANRVERPTLVGHSFGCHVVVDLAARRPERVARVVLAAPMADPRSRTATRQVIRLLADAAREPVSLVPLAAADYLRAGLVRAARTLRFALRYELEDVLPRVRAPARVVRGERDPLVPHWWAREVARLLPAGELTTISGAAHAINYSRPDEFARLVLDFHGRE